MNLNALYIQIEFILFQYTNHFCILLVLHGSFLCWLKFERHTQVFERSICHAKLRIAHSQQTKHLKANIG